ncbi:MAG TPA: hypothetical protein VF765_01505 [Polyangiaceae bacterium]
MSSRQLDRITPTVDLAPLARTAEDESEASPPSQVRLIALGSTVPWLMVTLDELRGLPIDPRAAYLVSLVDGQCSLEMIADIAGMERSVVAGVFAMLARLGAIELRDAHPATSLDSVMPRGE